MGNLVIVYGEATELESALERLARTELADKARVIEGRAADASRGREDPVDGSVGAVPLDSGGTIMAPPIAVGAGVPVSPQGGMLPYAAVLVPADTRRSADTEVAGGVGQLHSLAELDDLVGGNEEEVRHYEQILRGGGSLLVVEGGEEDLDLAQRILAPGGGQVARH
jgi:hypothetical protein